MIKLLRDYRGILTDEKLIEKGQYPETQFSPESVSLLLEKGYAVRIGIDFAEGEDFTTVTALPLEEGETGAIPSLAELRERYEELAGKKVFNGWDAETLATKIAELEGNA